MTQPEATHAQRLEAATRTVARIVQDHGDVYLPILDRLLQELTQYRQRQAVLRQIVASVEPPTIELTAMEVRS